MSLLQYLQLQPVDPQDDGSVSDLDEFKQDDTIDLTQDIDEATLDATWDRILSDNDDEKQSPPSA